MLTSRTAAADSVVRRPANTSVKTLDPLQVPLAHHQAKGRVERANRTLQDRLVKELRLAGVGDMEAGNAFAPAFVERYNDRFAVRAASSNNLHRPMSLNAQKLNDILCHREQRYVGAQLTFHYDRKQIILERSAISEKLAAHYVEVYDFPDGPLEVRWNGRALPYRVFCKDQRVNHTAIVENKRLSHALTLVKAQQDLKLPTKVMTNSEKTGYKKRPRIVCGPDFDEKTRSRAAVEMTIYGKHGRQDDETVLPPTLPTDLGKRQRTALPTLRTARRRRSI